MLDNPKPVRCPGMWRHRCGKRYELDIFVGDASMVQCVRSVTKAPCEASDHTPKCCFCNCRVRNKSFRASFVGRRSTRLYNGGGATVVSGLNAATSSRSAPWADGGRRGAPGCYGAVVRFRLDALLGPALGSLPAAPAASRQCLRQKTAWPKGITSRAGGVLDGPHGRRGCAGVGARSDEGAGECHGRRPTSTGGDVVRRNTPGTSTALGSNGFDSSSATLSCGPRRFGTGVCGLAQDGAWVLCGVTDRA